MSNDITIERYIEQVADGKRYKGYVTLGGQKLHYRLDFPTPIPELAAREYGKEDTLPESDFPNLKIGKKDAIIKLSADEREFFLWLLFEFALDFCELEMTRSMNEESETAPFVKGATRLGAMDRRMRPMGATICMRGKCCISATPELLVMLSKPKFGCVFP